MEQFSTYSRAHLMTMLHDRGLAEYVNEFDLPYLLLALMLRIEKLEKQAGIPEPITYTPRACDYGEIETHETEEYTLPGHEMWVV